MIEPAIRRQRRKVLTDAMIKNLPRRPKRYPLSDPQQLGHFIRVMPQGPHSFVAVARDPYHRQVWVTLGTTDELKVGEAREQCRAVRKRVAAGLPAVEPPPPKPETFAAVADNWLRQHVDKTGVRTAGDFRRILAKHVLPVWGERDFRSLKRSDLARLLDEVEGTKHRSHLADKTATILRSMGSWFADRDDNYTSPFAKVRSRVPEHARKRSRVLADEEVRAIWKTAGTAGTFGALVQLLLLTGQRRAKLLTLKWDDISPDGLWTIATQVREKPNAGELQLPAQALEIIKAQPRLVGSPFVFATRGSFDNRAKKAFAAKAGVFGWRLHDLRRTSRTLLSRAGVQPHVAERVLGHAVGNIESVYDKHKYTPEKGEALRKLAALIEHIVAGPTDGSNVVPFEATAS